MRKIHWFKSVSGVLAVSLISAIALASPAQAYGSNLSKLYAVVDTDNCDTDGTIALDDETSTTCIIYDEIDGTYFTKDANALAVKFEFRLSGALVAKVEWHPYGETLWVYDDRDDNDTIYVELLIGDPQYSNPGPFRAPELGHIQKSFDLPEGTPVWVMVWDSLDSNGEPANFLISQLGTA
jgi:hypothetical protein